MTRLEILPPKNAHHRGSTSSSSLLHKPQSSPHITATTNATSSSNLSPSPVIVSCSTDCIRDVWGSNLLEEMARIQSVAERYRFVSIDTEFPGVVVTPIVTSDSSSYQWNTIRCNVNLLKIIQLGLTFCDQYGNYPPGIRTWQFNFHFDVSSDMYAQDSLEMLEKAGLDFERHCEDGVDVNIFAELMISSGLVLSGDMHWIAFHSGYDFGYLMKVLTNNELPETEDEFLEQIRTWFGHVYDVKYLVKNCPTLNHRTGLNQLASEMKIERIGPAHQAGSDSLITCTLFFRLCQGLQPYVKNVTQYASILYGLGEDSADSMRQYSKDSFQPQTTNTSPTTHCYPPTTSTTRQQMEVY